MSYELRIYSSREPISRRKLARNFRLQILPDSLRWQLRFLTDAGKLLPEDGPLGTGIVLVWPASSPDHRDIERLVASGDGAGRDAAYARNRIASAELKVLGRRFRGWRDVVSLDAVPEEHRDAVAAARTYYHIETHAGRNKLSERFPFVLRRMLAGLEYGLVEDPQN